MSISHTLSALQTQGLDRLEAQRLLLHALGRPDHDRAWLLGHGTGEVPVDAQSRLQALLQRHAAGEPMGYLLGHQPFYGLDLHVDARVLVPRPDTETLVDWALGVFPASHNTKAIDLGTGSGAIALALKATRPHWTITALDFSTDALAVAQANAVRLGLDIRLLEGAWLSGVAERFDLIVSNPPYIAAADDHLATLTHEPLQALASGADGLDDIRHIISESVHCLTPGGWLLLEHGYDQAVAVRGLLHGAGFGQVRSRCDLAGIERCSGGQWGQPGKG